MLMYINLMCVFILVWIQHIYIANMFVTMSCCAGKCKHTHLFDEQLINLLFFRCHHVYNGDVSIFTFEYIYVYALIYSC